MRILLALQYHAGDSDEAFALAELLADIEPAPGPPCWSILFWRDPHAPPPPPALADRLASRGIEVHDHASPPCPGGWPAGPNAMWCHLAARLADDPSFCPGYDHVLTAEPDSVPLRADWAERLLRGHLDMLSPAIHATGHRCDLPAPHINGNMIIRRDIAAIHPPLRVPPPKAWDMHHAEWFLQHCADHPDLVSDYKCGDRHTLRIWSQTKHGRTDLAWLHGPKKMAAITEARRRLVGPLGEIPRRIHQIWAGPDPLPPHCRKWCERLQAMNPSWDYKLHGNELIERYAADPVIQRQAMVEAPWAFRADRLRTLLLFEEGGAYIDVDVQPIRPLDGILEAFPGAGFICARLADDHMPDVGILFSAPGSLAASILVREATATLSTGRSMLRLLDKAPGVTFAPSEWWFAKNSPDAVYLYGEGHHLHSWGAQRNVAELQHRFALLACDKAGEWHLIGTAPSQSVLMPDLDRIDTAILPKAGIFKITKDQAMKFKRA